MSNSVPPWERKAPDNEMPPQPPKAEFQPPEVRFILPVMIIVYFIRSIAWAISILKTKRE
jgi:hypothetical protein